MPGAHWGNHKRKRSRTYSNRTRSCSERIGSVHREKPPPFCERSANVLWNETKRKKLSGVQLCCHTHGTLLPYVAILPVIGRYRLKMAASSIVSDAQLSKSYVAAIWNLLVTIFLLLFTIHFWYVLLRSATFTFVISPVGTGLKPGAHRALIEILRCYHMKPGCYHILTFVYNSFWLRSATDFPSGHRAL